MHGQSKQEFTFATPTGPRTASLTDFWTPWELRGSDYALEWLAWYIALSVTSPN